MKNQTVAVIGAGCKEERPGIGHHHLEKLIGLLPDKYFSRVCFSRTSPEKVIQTDRIIHEKFGHLDNVVGHSDFVELIDCEQPSTVIVATPTHTHPAVFEELLARNRNLTNLLVEKPSSLDYWTSRAMAYSAQGRGIAYGINLQMAACHLPENEAKIKSLAGATLQELMQQMKHFKYIWQSPGTSEESTARHLPFDLASHGLIWIPSEFLMDCEVVDARPGTDKAYFKISSPHFTGEFDLLYKNDGTPYERKLLISADTDYEFAFGGETSEGIYRPTITMRLPEGDAGKIRLPKDFSLQSILATLRGDPLVPAEQELAQQKLLSNAADRLERCEYENNLK